MKNLIIIIVFSAIQLNSFSQLLFPVTPEGEVVFPEEHVNIREFEREKAMLNPDSVFYIEDAMEEKLVMTGFLKGKFAQEKTKAIISDGEKIKLVKVSPEVKQTQEEVVWAVVFLWFSFFTFLFILITENLSSEKSMTLKVFGILFGLISIIGMIFSAVRMLSLEILLSMTIASFFLFIVSRSASEEIKKIVPFFYIGCLLITLLAIYF